MDELSMFTVQRMEWQFSVHRQYHVLAGGQGSIRNLSELRSRGMLTGSEQITFRPSESPVSVRLELRQANGCGQLASILQHHSVREDMQR
jgi:hypothetical protein